MAKRSTKKHSWRKRSAGPPSKMLERAMLGLLASQRLDRMARYAREGRRFQGLSDRDLALQWVAAFKASADDPRNAEKRIVERDFDSEFYLRDKEPPAHLVKEAAEKLFAATDAIQRKFEKEDPEGFREFRRELDIELLAYLQNRKRGN